MIYAVITLIIVAIVLFVLSFFTHDKIAELEGQIEEVSLSSIQNSYQINKKINILEEELLVDQLDMTTPSKESTNELHIPTIEKIKQLHIQGTNIEDISKETGLSTNDIKAIVRNFD